MAGFELAELPLAAGVVALAPLPGGSGDFSGDLAALVAWKPSLVISLTESAEMAALGAGALAQVLLAEGVGWRHLPIRDYGIPGEAQVAPWRDLSEDVAGVLQAGGRVLVHCRGGCGRSGMAVLRLMVDLGEPAPQALERLRAVRPCAIETAAQLEWATAQESARGG
jgi:protein-tyrosine phosphatase